MLIIGFVLWELHRESKGESVLMPMSMWTQPGAKMGSTILLVFFGWWAFNTLGYYLPLFYQEVQLYSPIQTAVHLIPSGIAVSSLVQTSYAPCAVLTWTMSGLHCKHGYRIPCLTYSRTDPSPRRRSLDSGKPLSTSCPFAFNLRSRLQVSYLV